MGRPIFEIYFKCKCGETHGTNIFVSFVLPLTPETSAADVYRNDSLPEKLKSFLASRFVCTVNNEIRELPELNDFFFAFTGESTMIVA
jgi:hypothetical protein